MGAHSAMEKLKCSTKASSYDELEQIMRERAFYEAMSSLCPMPLLIVQQKGSEKLFRTDATRWNVAQSWLPEETVPEGADPTPTYFVRTLGAGTKAQKILASLQHETPIYAISPDGHLRKYVEGISSWNDSMSMDEDNDRFQYKHMASAEPAWLNADLFEKVLRNAERNEYIKVLNVITMPAVAKGNNHMSDVFRVQVKFSSDPKGEDIAETYLIVKIAPYGDFREEMLKEGEFFTTEISMMTTTLPKMNTFLKKIGVTSLSVRCIHFQHEAPTHIILEDLAQKSFIMVDRRAGLDLDHSLIAVRKIAAFHASSILLREEDPKAVTKYWRGLVNTDQPASLNEAFNGITKGLGTVVAKWQELSPRISEKLIKLSDVTYQKASEAARFREDDFNVLNHGDCLITNMMFAYDDDEKPTDMIFVDFQVNRYGSPAIDLLNFLGASPNDNVREHKRELLLREYHASLTSTMAKLKCKTKAPSFDELQQILKERGFYEVYSSFCVMPSVLAEDSENFAEQMQEDGTCDHAGYRGKQYRKVLTRLLPLYDSLGLLDL